MDEPLFPHEHISHSSFVWQQRSCISNWSATSALNAFWLRWTGTYPAWQTHQPVYNVTKHALGVIVNKLVRGKILAKRINVRIEHVKPSRCREDFLRCVKENDKARHELKQKNPKAKICLKRKPAPSRGEQLIVNPPEPVFLAPIPYEFIA